MSRFDYPPVPKDTDQGQPVAAMDMGEGGGQSVFPGKWEREIRIPVSAEILQGMQVGDQVEVTLRGKVTTLNSEESNGKARAYLSVLVQSVEAMPDDGDDESSEESFNRSFDKGPKQLGRRYQS